MPFVEQNAVWLIILIIFSVFGQNLASYFRCYHESIGDFTEVPVTSPDTLITDPKPCIDKEKDVVIICLGFQSDPDNGDLVAALVAEYVSLRTHNVILINAKKELSGLGLGPLGYPVAVKESKKVAKDVADATVRLVELGMSKNIHYLGHSLGAHTMGQAGRYTIEQDFTVPWLTGLDPARPGFEGIPIDYPPVDSTCANFVDIAHTDPGGYGLNKSTGHIDVYFNYGLYLDGTRRQPGCTKGSAPNEIFTGGNSCSHKRSWQFYNISLTNPELFKIGQAKDYNEWVEKDGQFSVTTYFGPKIDKTQRGNFYCSTTDTEPWGKQDAGLVA